MGLREWWRRRRPAPLVDAPSAPVELTARTVAVHTAEDMVVVTVDADAAAGLLPALSDASAPVRLTAPGARPVSFLPAVDPRQAPTLDPDEGWLIPLTDEVRAELVDLVRPEPGAWEIPGINLGVVVEA